MIVKDESETLPACLESVRGLPDEIVIGDTGSQDSSPSIARSAGAKVLSLAWGDDFSAARNQTLDAATGEWILVLDADEELTPKGRETLRRAIQDDTMMGYNLPVTSPFGPGKEITSLLMRLFRNRPDVRFKNLIHEQVHDAVETAAKREGKKIAPLNATILHRGYQPDVYKHREKDSRNGRILEKQVAREPEDLYSLLKFAEHLFKTQDESRWEKTVTKAHRLLHENWETGSKRVYAAEICGHYGVFLEKNGREAEALAHCRAMDSELLPTANFLYFYGRMEFRAGNAERAAGIFEACLAQGKRSSPVPARHGITGFLSHHALGTALQQLGKADRAASCFRQALAENARHYASIEALTELLTSRGQLRESIQLLTDYLREQPEDCRAWLWGGALLTKHRLYRQAVPWLERALRSETTATEAARLVDGIQNVLRRNENSRSQLQ